MITSGQMKAARAMLDWSQPQLAEASGLSLPTIQRMETKGTESSKAGNVEAVRLALEAAGIVFIPSGTYHGEGEAGVRLAKASIPT